MVKAGVIVICLWDPMVCNSSDKVLALMDPERCIAQTVHFYRLFLKFFDRCVAAQQMACTIPATCLDGG